jgi:hypothetical protein
MRELSRAIAIQQEMYGAMARLPVSRFPGWQEAREAAVGDGAGSSRTSPQPPHCAKDHVPPSPAVERTSPNSAVRRALHNGHGPPYGVRVTTLPARPR